MAPQARHTLHYGWVIFGLSFINLVTEGGLKSTIPVVYVALRDSFHWSAAVTSGVFSLAGLVGGLGAPLLGRLLDRLGPRALSPATAWAEGAQFNGRPSPWADCSFCWGGAPVAS
jgi:MFS family permease